MNKPSTPDSDYAMSFLRVDVNQRADGVFEVLMHTTRGVISAELYLSEGSPGAVLWGGVRRREEDSSRQPVYADLAQELVADGITSLRIFYRWPGGAPGPFEECVMDTLGGVSFLKTLGAKGIALVGHSFSGGVVIRAAAISPHVTAVIALASQLYGTQPVASLSPRPLLLIHGTDDQVLECESSRIIYEQAKEPKEIVLFDGAGHGFRECKDELRALMKGWLISKVGPQALEKGNGAFS